MYSPYSEEVQVLLLAYKADLENIFQVCLDSMCCSRDELDSFGDYEVYRKQSYINGAYFTANALQRSIIDLTQDIDRYSCATVKSHFIQIREQLSAFFHLYFGQISDNINRYLNNIARHLINDEYLVN